MIIDQDTNPKLNLYYLGSQVIKLLKQSSDKEFNFIELYYQFRISHDIEIGRYLLVLDWLFLLEIIKQDEKGRIVKCF